MSTAHRPTWDPAQAKDTKSGSRQYSARDVPSQTKLKFRQPGQSSSSDVLRKDLRAELLAAEAEARDKKRKAEGKPIEGPSSSMAIEDSKEGVVDDEANKRRKVLQDALELDKDDEDDEDKDDDDDSDEEQDEDDTAELLRELEKIKRERAAEKERQEKEQNAQSAIDREEEIAMGNPLLNLAAALGQQPQAGGAGVSATTGAFSVKRRWDDDLIFKNQAVNANDKQSGQFVNDLLRTEFHKKFMAKFIK